MHLIKISNIWNRIVEAGVRFRKKCGIWGQ